MKEQIAEIANQPYIPNTGHLFVFVVDQRRNTLIAEAKGAKALVQGSPERFISAFSDAMIAAQNMVVAAESLGMGTVYLGSILMIMLNFQSSSNFQSMSIQQLV